MNWGTKIAVFYTFFALSMICAVIYASQQSFDLVSPDYYAEEIVYETRIQEIQHVQELKTPLSIKAESPESLQIVFPSELNINSGNIRFYRPSDASLDRNFAVDPTQSVHHISLAGWEKGNWDLQIRWTDGERNYYDERKIQVLP